MQIEYQIYVATFKKKYVFFNDTLNIRGIKVSKYILLHPLHSQAQFETLYAATRYNNVVLNDTGREYQYSCCVCFYNLNCFKF